MQIQLHNMELTNFMVILLVSVITSKDVKSSCDFTYDTYRHIWRSFGGPTLYIPVTGIINCTSIVLKNNQSLEQQFTYDKQNAKKFKTLIISESSIPVVYNSIFKDFGQLTRIVLNGNNIEDIQPNAFISTTEVEKLEIRNNKLSKINKDVFNGLTDMKILDMSYNNLSTLEYLNNLPALEELYVTNNNLIKIYFQGLNTLKILDLSYNKLTTIKENDFKEMNKLKILNLSYNNIYLLDFINQIQSLEVLNMSSNSISNIKDLQNLQSLKSLDLSYNSIYNLKSNLFKNSHNFTTLILRHNFIKSFHPNDLFHKPISHLDLSLNVIETIQCDQIQGFVNLSGNFLKTVCHFENLTSLDLSSNMLPEIKKDHFNHLKKLTYLKLSENLITNVNIDAFENLDMLNSLFIDNNEIENLEIGIFRDLNSLKTLDISSNFLKNISFGIFTGLHNLTLLNLANNRIEFIDFSIFYPLTELTELYLHSNPLISFSYYRLTDHLSHLQHLSVQVEKMSCPELIRKINYLSNHDVEIQKGDHVKGSNVHGIACEPETEDTRAHEDFERLRNFFTTIVSLFFLVIGMFIILFVSHVISWYKNYTKSKKMFVKKNNPSCSLTLLTEIYQD